MDFCKVEGCNESTSCPILVLRVLGELSLLAILSIIVVYSNIIQTSISDCYDTKITFKINNIQNSDFCVDYRDKYFNNTINKISDVSSFNDSLNDFKNRMFIDKIFLIILLVLSCISVYNSILTGIFYQVSWNEEIDEYPGNKCFIVTGIKFIIFLILFAFFLFFHLYGKIKFKEEFLDDILKFFDLCLVDKNFNSFSDLDEYLNRITLLSIIGFSIKFIINILFIIFEIFRYIYNRDEYKISGKDVLETFCTIFCCIWCC